MRSRISRPTAFALVLAMGALAAGCDRDATSITRQQDSFCSIPEDQLFDGGPGRDGIPALNGPELALAGEPEADYLEPGSRVIGFMLEGIPVAVPHSILWVHEIVNLDIGSSSAAVTYCPLTGSSLVFDRSAVGGAELGVSGLLYLNNLVMFDRTDQESLWAQMGRRAVCGPRDGTRMEAVPLAEMTWEGWTSLHPDTRVPANLPETGRDFAAYGYPYGNYEDPDNTSLLFPIPFLDPRRPPKERVLGISPGGPEGLAFPFDELDAGGEVNVVRATVGGGAVVIFWDRARQAAVAHRPTTGDRFLTFRVESGAVVDDQTDSTWSVDGQAVGGPLEGERLDPVPEAHVAFWFAWAAFHPATFVLDGGTYVEPPIRDGS